MAQRGGQIGNNNAGKNKPFLAALNRAAELTSVSERKAALDDLAIKVWELALAGEQWAAQEIINRYDGKPAQQLIHSGDEDAPMAFTEIIRKVID